MTEREVLTEIIKAWNSLPRGYHSPTKVERWLAKEMKPAIDLARTILAERAAEE